MPVHVEYHDGLLTFDAPADRLVAAFSPRQAPPGDPRDSLRRALESPLDYPPLRQVAVPGDRVAIPLDPSLPEASLALAAVAEVLAGVGVESIAAVVDGRQRDRAAIDCPNGVELVIHDPTERESIAYLASTQTGRRIYLNRRVADADCVVAIGRLGPDGALGLRGPWSVIDPHLSDEERGAAPLLSGAPGSSASARLDESLEVSWLLGSQLQVGIVPASSGWGEIVCGQPATVRERGGRLVTELWGLALDDRADLAIAGLGGPGRAASAEDFLDGLRRALGSVRLGGKVAVLSRLEIGTIREALRGEMLPRGDWEKALAWADIYLASSAHPDDVDELGLIPLDRPEQAGKLAALAPSFVAIGQADRVRLVMAEETDG